MVDEDSAKFFTAFSSSALLKAPAVEIRVNCVVESVLLAIPLQIANIIEPDITKSE